MSDVAVLRAEGARIEAEGSVLLDELTFSVTGRALGLVGAWEPVLRLWSWSATLARGTLTMDGEGPDTAISSGCIGIGALDTDIPVEGTALDFLTTGARLTGKDLTRRGARKRAVSVLERLGAGALAKRRLRDLNPTERRAVGIVHAALGEPRVLVLPRPLSGMEGAAAESLTTLVERAAEGRCLVVTAESPGAFGPEAALLGQADQVCVLAAGSVVAWGAPTEVLVVGTRYLVHTLRARRALEAALAERGIEAERLPGDASPETGDDAGRLVVRLSPEGDTRAIVEAALAVGAPIVELLPVGLRAARRTPP